MAQEHLRHTTSPAEAGWLVSCNGQEATHVRPRSGEHLGVKTWASITHGPVSATCVSLDLSDPRAPSAATPVRATARDVVERQFSVEFAVRGRRGLHAEAGDRSMMATGPEVSSSAMTSDAGRALTHTSRASAPPGVTLRVVVRSLARRCISGMFIRRRVRCPIAAPTTMGPSGSKPRGDRRAGNHPETARAGWGSGSA
jgi:hypothetical protein